MNLLRESQDKHREHIDVSAGSGAYISGPPPYTRSECSGCGLVDVPEFNDLAPCDTHWFSTGGETTIRRPSRVPVLSVAAMVALGPHGVERFEAFIRIPEPERRSQRLMQQTSIDNMESYIGAHPRLKDHEPSIFMTDDGYLQLQWEDLSNKTVELEFRAATIEFFIERTGAEDRMPVDRVHSLIQMVDAE